MLNDSKDIAARIKRLEDAVFGTRRAISRAPTVQSSFTGPKGGVQLLISKGFFAKKKTAAEVREKLVGENYHYSIQAVQTALNRMASVKGPLVALSEGGRKCYVARK